MGSGVRFGLVTPVLTLLPRAHARWEDEAGIAEVERIVVEADRLGYDHVTCSEHVAVPVDVAEVRGGRYWDPLATFGYLAAKTARIRFATYVLVLGYHHPLAIAKRYGTLDQVAGGRLVLGVGVGSLEPEFALLDAEFERRGEVADDALRALRAALGRTHPSYAGPHFAFADVIVDPCARQERMPLWVGGRTRRSLRRAVALADGWAPFGLGADEVRSWLATEDVDASFEVVLQPSRPLDPTDEPGEAADAIGALVEAGATMVDLRFVHHSVDHCIEQLAAMCEVPLRVSEVAAGFFSFTEVTRPDEHHAYNEWHQLDHLPEQYTLPGIVWGERWVSTPACRAARAASEPPLDAVHYLTAYLVAPPVEASLAAFMRLAQELRDLDRFHEHRRAHLTGAHDIIATAAAPRVLVSAAAVPFRPNTGVHVRVETACGVDAAAERVQALAEVPGVAGAWAFRRRPGPPDDRFPEPPEVVTLAWLDGPPLEVAASVASLPAGRGAAMFEGPFERVEVGRWDWFDAPAGSR